MCDSRLYYKSIEAHDKLQAVVTYWKCKYVPFTDSKLDTNSLALRVDVSIQRRLAQPVRPATVENDIRFMRGRMVVGSRREIFLRDLPVATLGPFTGLHGCQRALEVSVS